LEFTYQYVQFYDMIIINLEEFFFLLPGETVMNLPKMFQTESLTRLAQGAVVGAVVTIALGFGLGGWTLDSTAEEMAAGRTTAALVAAYAPVCVERYNANATPEQRDAFSSESAWNRDSVIEKAGYATLPGSQSPNRAVADACAAALTKIIAEIPAAN
jgi:hypothetical protein